MRSLVAPMQDLEFHVKSDFSPFSQHLFWPSKTTGSNWLSSVYHNIASNESVWILTICWRRCSRGTRWWLEETTTTKTCLQFYTLDHHHHHCGKSSSWCTRVRNRQTVAEGLLLSCMELLSRQWTVSTNSFYCVQQWNRLVKWCFFGQQFHCRWAALLLRINWRAMQSAVS